MSEPRAQRNVAPTSLRFPGKRVDEATPRLGPNDAFVRFAYAVLERETAVLAAHRRSGEEMPTPDDVHDLRVAARRLRVALKLFRRVLPRDEAAHYRDELRWFAKSLGDARDLDVYAESFKAYAQTLPPAQRAEFRGYELYLRRERAKARRRAAAAFASARATQLVAGLERFAAAGQSAGALRRARTLRIRDAARRSIRGSVARVRRIGRALTARSRPTALHKLRIKSKRLRYELEFFAEAFPQLAATANACKAMQDLLGEHQDAYTANARLRRYAALLRKQGGRGELPPALEKLRKRQLEHARALRESFEQRWPDFAKAIDAARRAVA